jgi:small subunit ribosomal protein S21
LKRHDRSNDKIISGLRVEVRNGDVNGALRKFKKKIQESGILQELRERQEYTKPSQVRKKAKAAARARWLKQQRKMELDGNPSNIKRRK